jgi:hypothetical protein
MPALCRLGIVSFAKSLPAVYLMLTGNTRHYRIPQPPVNNLTVNGISKPLALPYWATPIRHDLPRHD